MAEIGLTKNQIIALLSQSTHGDLEQYIKPGMTAAQESPEFFAHLIAWNRLKGQIRDSKVAMPLVALMAPDLDEEFVANAYAHVTLLGPREMLAALRFVDGHRPLMMGHIGAIKRMISGKFHQMEKNWPKWERTMLQHRSTLREIFAIISYPPTDARTDACIFGRRGKTRLPYPEGGLFETVSQLYSMPALEAAGTILTKKIPFLIAAAAMREKMKDPDILLALIKNMTANELVTNTKNLEKWGMKTNSMLRGAYNEALSKARTSTTNLLKATTAAEAMEDEDLKAGLQELQEKQIQKVGGVEGDWLVLADKSLSMHESIAVGREVAATLAKMVKGKVYLTFFDTTPRTEDVTGKTLDEIKAKTRHVSAGGNTSIGCGLMNLYDKAINIDGIAIVSDGGDNTNPYFHSAYRLYSEKIGKQVPVYFYQVAGDPPNVVSNMKQSGFDLQIFDLRHQQHDYYSLPNLVQTMRTNRYSLIDEIMDVGLLKLPDEIKHWKREIKHASA